MSKFVEAMDAFVRLVVLTVFATGALQFSCVVNSPYTSVAAYPQYRAERHGPAHIDDPFREPRQIHDSNKSSIVEDIFNIPISALQAVNTLVQNSRPAIQRLRESAQRRLENAQLAHIEQERIPRRHRKRHRQQALQSKAVQDIADEPETTTIVMLKSTTV